MPKLPTGRAAALTIKHAGGAYYPAFPHSFEPRWNKKGVCVFGDCGAKKANRQLYKWLFMKVYRHYDLSYRAALEETCELNHGMTHQQMAREQRG